jgi:hypothetical protein
MKSKMKDYIRQKNVSDEELRFYHREGYVVLEQLLDEKYLPKIKADVMALMGQIGLGESKLRQTGEYLKRSYLDGLVNSSRLRDTASELLVGSAHLYLPFTAVKTAGGGGAFDFHQDNQYTQHRGGGSLNFWIALVDMEVKNGCLYVDPRSHTKGTLEAEILDDGHRKVEPEAPIPLEIRAGDAIAFSRLLVHGSTINQSKDHRVAYAVQFHREDTEAMMDGEWKLLKDHPRFDVAPKGSMEEIQS